MNRHCVVFAAPGRVDVVEERLGAPPPGFLLVRTAVSAISAGTELLAFQGRLPADLPLDETLGAMAGGTFRYPFRYGYAAVGEVLAAGEDVDPEWLGRNVFAFQPHASAFLVAAADAVAVPAALPAERAALLANMETAVNLVLDGAPLLGERAVVVGQGPVGLLTAALLARFPLEALVAIEALPLRARAAAGLGVKRVLRPDEPLAAALGPGGADLVYELTGNPEALDLAIAAAGREGRVVVGSWYGEKRAPVALGGAFHRGRLRLISSQVSHIAPSLSARWDRARRFATAWRALEALDTAALVTHRFPIAEAQKAYDLLAQHPDQAIQVLLSAS
jgi:2-desacetyl-2-hydroxyethyl bacteriochlorophyllide A dehydrogenase